MNQDLEEYGDERNSNIVVVEEAKAFDEKDLISNDPMTVVLSKRGWIRAAKGHDIDPQSLQYREETNICPLQWLEIVKTL